MKLHSRSRQAMTSSPDDEKREGSMTNSFVKADHLRRDGLVKFKIRRHWLGCLDTAYDFRALQNLFGGEGG